MIDFLKDINISDIVIDKIKDNNNDAILFDLYCNMDNVIKIINYLRKININNIDDLLIYKVDLFLLDYDDLIKKFSKFNIPIFVNLINNDYSSSDILFEE